MADYLPKFKPGSSVTFVTTTDVTGGRLVIATGNRSVGVAGADSALVVGVASVDATSGDSVMVFTRPTGVHQLTASAAISVGAKVNSAATGKVASGGTNAIGIALEAAAADGDVIDVLFI